MPPSSHTKVAKLRSVSPLSRTAARFRCQDYGKGIPLDFQERVFDTFAQGDNTDTRQSGGTGLGLSISKSIVQRHGGKLDLESTFGEGALFFFNLPTDG